MRTKPYFLYFFILFLFIQLPNISAKNGHDKDSLVIKADAYRMSRPKEKIYLHLDKPYYMAGETIWFAAYLRDAFSLEYSNISKSIYVELLAPDGKILQTRNIYSESLMNHGDFQLETSLLSGRYRIRAYTTWMRNFNEQEFFEQEIFVHQVASVENDEVAPQIPASPIAFENQSQTPSRFDIQFFPEGGKSIIGIAGRVGMKLINEMGKGEAFSGAVYNSRGELLTQVESNEFGLSSFFYLPEKGQDYYFELDGKYKADQKKFALKPAEEEGAVLRVRNMLDEKAKIEVMFSSAAVNKGGHIVVTSLEKVIGVLPIEPEMVLSRYTVLLDSINDGIMRFTLLDHMDQPVAERIIFVYNSPVIVPQLTKTSFTKREKVDLSVALTNTQGLPLVGIASMSVTDKNLVDIHAKTDNIVSELLMSNEIKGKIERPSWYFEAYNDNKRKALDLLMLTQGWRNFKWMERLDDAIPEYKFLPEQGITVSGMTNNFWNENKTQKAKVSMTSIGTPFMHEETVTSDSGSFSFTGMVFFDSIYLVFQPRKYNVKKDIVTKSKNVFISILENDAPISKPIMDSPNVIIDKSAIESLENEVLKIEQIERAFGEKTIVLEEVTVTNNKLIDEDKFNRPGKIYSSYAYRSVMDSLPGSEGSSLLNFVRRDPRMNRIFRRSSNFLGTGDTPDTDWAPIWLDGRQLTLEEADFTFMSSIEFVEYLNSVQSVIVAGAPTAYGIVMAYSRRGTESYRISTTNTLTHPGFYVGKEFYKPVYELSEDINSPKPDHRITLHWEPAISFDESGTTDLSFYTDDKSTDYRIEIEGVTEGGHPFYQVIDFSNK